MGKKRKQEQNKAKRQMKMQMQKVEEERDYIQEWKERGRLKPFTEEGVEEAQYVAQYLNHTNDEPKPASLWERFIAVWKKFKDYVMKWM